jgi:hypothetical protein
MTSANSSEDLHQGRGWLNRAAEMLDSCEDHVSDAEFARAAAAIGNGFIALAHTERAARTAGALDAAAERVRRAAAESRPHDDEPVLGDVIKCQQCGRQTRSISRGCSACGHGLPCACCASGIIPVFEGPKCGRGLGPDGCGHTHAEHAGYDRG